MPNLASKCTCLLFILFIHQSIADRNHLGFGFDSKKESVSINFKNINNLIVLEATVDGGEQLNLILDTGIRSLVLFNKSYIPEVSEQTFEIEFKGVGMERPMPAKVSVNHNLRLSDDVVARQINAVILKRSNSKIHYINGIKIHGAFGYQLFARFRVEIDYENQQMTLYEPDNLPNPPGYDAIPIKIHDTKPFIESDILTQNEDWLKLNLLLDLGANHDLLLHKLSHNTELLKKKGNRRNDRIAEGLSGSIYGQKSVIEGLRIGGIEYRKTSVLLPSVKSYHQEKLDIEKHGSIGGGFFERSKIILDYVNGYLYVKQKTDNSLAPVITLID